MIEAADPARKRGEALAGKLAGYPGPAYRKAYLSRLLRSGLDHLRNGNVRTAEYCLGKVESELESALSAAADLSASVPSPGPEADTSPRHALERLRARWREERVRRTEAVLDRHGPRLSSLERKAYRDRLAGLSRPPAPGSVPGADARADSGLQDLRRRLYGRILKTQKSALARRRGAGGSALARVHETHPGPIGPYNDLHNLEGVLDMLAQADPAWVEEFLELYRNLSGLKGLIPSAPR